MAIASRSRLIRRSMVAATLAAAPVLALGFSPAASADAVSKHFSSCNTTGGSDPIWEGVKPPVHTPKHMGKNFDIQWPGHDSTKGWAVKPGADMKATQNLLVVPTVRESGIECVNLLEAGAPNYFKHAYDEIKLMSGTDWALGINSADGRTLNQLHIHLTRLYGSARNDIDAAAKAGKLAKSEQAWVNSPIEVTGHDMKGKETKHTYRAWNADGIDYNYFAKLNNDIVAPLKKQGKTDAGMRHEALLITLNRQGNGLVVLESDRNTGIHGVDNIETILDKA
jgi:CDP-diacylglycerol pyrophosphatase